MFNTSTGLAEVNNNSIVIVVTALALTIAIDYQATL